LASALRLHYRPATDEALKSPKMPKDFLTAFCSDIASDTYIGLQPLTASFNEFNSTKLVVCVIAQLTEML
jgi:hypothetical protein